MVLSLGNMKVIFRERENTRRTVDDVCGYVYVLVRPSIVAMKHHDRKQVWKNRVSFFIGVHFYIAVHH